ncbi:hypothetical protein D3C85_1304940 [compost metagenome]
MPASIGALGLGKEDNVVGWGLRRQGCVYPGAAGDDVPHGPHGCQPVVCGNHRIGRESFLICQPFPDKPDQPAVSRRSDQCLRCFCHSVGAQRPEPDQRIDWRTAAIFGKRADERMIFKLRQPFEQRAEKITLIAVAPNFEPVLTKLHRQVAKYLYERLIQHRAFFAIAAD